MRFKNATVVTTVSPFIHNYTCLEAAATCYFVYIMDGCLKINNNKHKNKYLPFLMFRSDQGMIIEEVLCGMKTTNF